MARIEGVELESIGGRYLLGPTGEKIGQAEGLYYDEATGEAQWIGVRAEGGGGELALIPIATVQLQDGSLRVPYARSRLMSVPGLGDGRRVPPETAQGLYAHYRTQPERATRVGARAVSEPGLSEELRWGQEEVKGIGQEIAGIAADLQVLFKQEIQLAKAEMGQQLGTSSHALFWGMAAGIWGFLMAAFLFVAVMFALELVFEPWLSALITTGVLASLAALFGLVAYQKLKKVKVVPQRTVESVKEDVEWARNQVK